MNVSTWAAAAMTWGLGGVDPLYGMPKHKEPKTCPECGDVGHGKYCKGTAESRHKMRRRV
jgi:hypothetical protein